MHGNEIKELPDYIKFENDELMIEKVPAKELLQEYGTPLFVISEKRIKQNYNRLYKAFY